MVFRPNDQIAKKLDICKKRGHLNSNSIFYKSINFDSGEKSIKIV